MNRPFSIEREPDWMMCEPVTSAAPEQTPQAPVWSFLGDFESLSGERSEPDAQFFVESWTLGVEAAMRNLEKRRRAGLKPAATYARSASSAEFLEENAFYTELSGAARNYRPYDDVRMPIEEEVEPFEYREAQRGAMSVQQARQILGVSAISSRLEIRAAYRREAACWHPDHAVWSTAEARRQATEQMMLINEAYRILR